jgi:mannose-6-phosphate isomerase-like protein (cupin superfamily)
MRPTILALFLTILPLLIATAGMASSPTDAPHPLAVPLHCEHGDCRVLNGVPQTSGMRSGFVRLQPGETVGWHTTGENEEAIVILNGHGEALIEGQPNQSFEAPALVYIPPATRHNVANTGKAPLEYVCVVAPAKQLLAGLPIK